MLRQLKVSTIRWSSAQVIYQSVRGPCGQLLFRLTPLRFGVSLLTAQDRNFLLFRFAVHCKFVLLYQSFVFLVQREQTPYIGAVTDHVRNPPAVRMPLSSTEALATYSQPSARRVAQEQA